MHTTNNTGNASNPYACIRSYNNSSFRSYKANDIETPSTSGHPIYLAKLVVDAGVPEHEHTYPETWTSNDLSASLFSPILLKISSHEIGTIPLFAPYPTIEYDFPEPV